MTVVPFRERAHHAAMSHSEMPTMRSRRLGGELRRMRLEAGLKVQEAADALECGQPKISQIENGKRGIRPLDLTMLLTLYGIEDEARKANIRRLAKQVHKVDWWSECEQLLRLSDSLKDFLTLEADSQLVRTYESMVLPGLLQTEAYMRQTFTDHGAEEAGRLIETRRRRKELLDDASGFCLRAVIDAPALHRINGTDDVVREQLDHLLGMSERPNVDIQVLPLEATLPQDQCPPFALLRMRGEHPVDVVWLEHITGGTLLEQRQDVPKYRQAWDELTAAALPPVATRQYIRDLLEAR